MASYFGPWGWELASKGRCYELIGIRAWKWFLRRSGRPQSRWRASVVDSSRRERLVARLRQHARFTREYEVRHLVGGFVMQTAGTTYVAMAGQGSLLVLTVLNAVFNGFPILLQRYNRVRVHTALRRLGVDHESR